MEPFLYSVAKYLYSHFSGELHDVVAVFPNKRAKAFFTKYLGEIVDKPVFAPKYYTITEYMQEIAGKQIGDPLTLFFIMYEVYVDVTGSKETFDDFLFYSEMIVADFDDIDKYQVNASSIFQNIKEIKDIENYFDYLTDEQKKYVNRFWDAFLSRQSDETKSFTDLWSVLINIYKKYNEKLDSLDLTYEGHAYRTAINKLENTNTEAPGQRVAFVGFNALNKCEEKLFNYLKNQKKALFFWDYDPYYMDEGRKLYHEASFFLMNLLETFPAPADFYFQSELISKSKEITVLNIPTTVGQAKALERAFSFIPEKWIDDPVKTAVTLADESLLLPLLTSLPEEVGEVNISMGYPLKESQVFSFVSMVLELHRNKKGAGDKAGFYYRDVIRMLQHGLLQSLFYDECKGLVDNIKTYNHIRVTPGVFQQTSSFIRLLFNGNVGVNEFVGYLLGIVEEIPVFLRDSKSKAIVIEQEAVFHLRAQLQRAEDVLSKVHVLYSFKSLVRILSKILQGASIPFSGEPLSGLQVMGVLETRNLDFDNLIVLSLNEGVFPKSGHVPSLIPYALRKAFELPTVEHQDAIFGYYFYRLLQRSENVVLVYSSSVNDLKSGEPSRFIQQLLHEERFNVKSYNLAYQVNPLEEKTIEVPKTEAVNKSLQQEFGEQGRALSPSAINSWLNCSLQFYYKYVAVLKESDEVEEEVEANVFGSILHKIMEDLYAAFLGREVQKVELEQLLKDKKGTNSIVRKAFFSEYLAPGKEYDEQAFSDLGGENIIVLNVLQNYVQNILKYDITQAPFTLHGLENKVESVITLPNGVNVKIGGLIDRLDERDTMLRVVDYKTGAEKLGFADVEELFCSDQLRNSAAFQALTYCSIVDSSKEISIIQPILYYIKKLNSGSYIGKLLEGKGRSKHKIEKYGEIKDEFEQRFNKVLDEIFISEGAFEQTDVDKRCSHCAYRSICQR